MFENISKENWINILRNTKFDDVTLKYLDDNEEKILDILLECNEISLNEKRREYVKFILEESLGNFEKNEDAAIDKILEIRDQNNYNILTFGKMLNGSTLVVYEFGDKIIKFGRYFPIYNEYFILQPEFSLNCGEKKYMTIFEKLPQVFERENSEIAQKMYNKVRDKGYVWFDAIGNNVGLTDNRIDENDDGLRIIDSDYMESVSKIYDRVRYEHKDLYEQYKDEAYVIYLRQYIQDKGYYSMEEKYKEFKKEQERLEIEQQDINKSKESISFLNKLKQEIVMLFNNKSDSKNGKEMK